MDSEDAKKQISGFKLSDELYKDLVEMRQERQAKYAALDDACNEAGEAIRKAKQKVEEAQGYFEEADRDYYSALSAVRDAITELLEEKSEAYKSTSRGEAINNWITEWSSLAEEIGGQDVDADWDGYDYCIDSLDDSDLPGQEPS